MKLNLITNCAFCIMNCALLISCASNRPVVTTHTERIEERVMPVAVGADTIEITEYRLQSADYTPSPAENAFGDFLLARHNTNGFAFCSCFVRQFPLKQGENKRGNQLSTKPQKHNSPILSPCIQTFTPSPTGLPLKQRENIASTTSVRSTRGVNISRYETDTTSTLRITLRHDTVYLPYTHHIRSDTIVIPDRICKTKLQKTQTANVLLILILIIVIIFLFKQKYKFYR